MYYFYRKRNRGHGICPLYRGCPLFGESVIRGFTVLYLLQCCQYSLIKLYSLGSIELEPLGALYLGLSLKCCTNIETLL